MCPFPVADCDRGRHNDAAGRRGGDDAHRSGPLRGGAPQDGPLAGQVHRGAQATRQAEPLPHRAGRGFNHIVFKVAFHNTSYLIGNLV